MRYSGAPAFRQSELSLYERCPRRYFYTHVLKLGGRRTTTPYEDMHEVVRLAMRDLLADPEASIEPGALAALIDRYWLTSPLAALPAGPVYRPLADQLIRRFAEGRTEGALVETGGLAFPLGGAEVRVDIDYALRVASGRVLLRQVQTGHRRSTVMAGASIMAMLFAARHAAPGHDAEVLFLSDGERERLELNDKPFETRRRKLEASITDILAGEFPTKASTRTCPKCPAFFTCGTLPEGPLEKNFG